MPCSPGMRRCLTSCQHRRSVEEYRLARYAEEQAREATTLGYATEEAAYGPLITFKDWLIGGRQSDNEH